MRPNSLILTLVLCMTFGNVVFTQINDSEPGRYIEEVMEPLSERGIETDDLSDLSDDLEYYRQNPLNINTASNDHLKVLYLLNEYQIAALIEYRELNGPIQSLYEMLYLPGFRQEDIERIQPFVFCGEKEISAPPFKQLIKCPKQQITLRYQRILEKQEGFKTISDSILQENPDKSKYLGTPEKLYFRYSFNANDILHAGLIAEKDPGEEFFNASNKKGFDFYSAYVAYTNTHTFMKEILVGDYHVRFGQGLLAWSSYSFGKTSYIGSMDKSAEVLHGNTSVDENRFLRGAAFTLGSERFSLSCFASGKHIDASLADTSIGKNMFAGLAETGYHATPTDLKKEDVLLRTTIGSNMQLNFKNFKLGLNGLYMLYDMDCIGGDQLYQNFQFRGDHFGGMSLDYRILLHKAQLYGETAYSNGHLASLNALMIFLKPEITLGMLHRHYDKEYYSYYADAFSQSTSVNNEDGFFLGTEMQFSKTWCRMYADLFSFPWLKYQVDLPSSGYEMFFECGRKINSAEVSFRYEHKEKPENTNEADNLCQVQPLVREKFRLKSKLPLGPYFNLQHQLEMTHAAIASDSDFFGCYISQDILIRKLKIPLEFTLRLAYFNAANYDVRIYAYERDVSSAGSSQMLYGKGWRYMVLIRWNATERISCQLKLAQSLYPGKESIGSGLTTIEGSHRTEVKFQCVFRL